MLGVWGGFGFTVRRSKTDCTSRRADGTGLNRQAGALSAGLVLDALAFSGNVLALQRLPLFLVQSIVAASVGVTAVIASLRGAQLSWKDWVSLAVLGIGLIFLSVTAVPGAAERISLDKDWLILLLAFVPAAIGLIGFRMKGRTSSIVMCCAAGLGSPE